MTIDKVEEADLLEEAETQLSIWRNCYHARGLTYQQLGKILKMGCLDASFKAKIERNLSVPEKRT